MPIAESLSDINTWFIDLPEFGRTPYHHDPSVIEGYVDSVAAMIIELNRPVILVGHSFGGLIAARVMQRQPSLIHQLIMLQPVLHPIKPKYKIQGITKLILKHLKPAKLKRERLKNKNFITSSKYLEDYVQDVARDLKSPRIRTTNAEVMSSLTQSKSIQLDPKVWDEAKINILWGDMNKEHHIPKSYEHVDITRIPYGHQFPIERLEQTAHWIRQVLKF